MSLCGTHSRDSRRCAREEALTYGTDANSRAIKLDWLPSVGNGMQPKRPHPTVCGDWQSPGTDSGAGRGSLREWQHHPRPSKGCTGDSGDPLSPVSATWHVDSGTKPAEEEEERPSEYGLRETTTLVQ